MRSLALIAAFVLGIVACAAVLAMADNTLPEPWRTGTSTSAGPAMPAAAIHTTTVQLSTYPYADCLLASQIGAAGVSYQALDWGCQLVAGPPAAQTYDLLVLSNDYLTVTILPELGGRVYQMVFKPTGNNELYSNPVLKPTSWGPPEQGWWLAAGGLEWSFPTDEHGYEWGIPWAYQVFSSSSGVTVTLRDSLVVTRPTIEVAVHLPADKAALIVRPRINNPTSLPVDVEYWTNAMLAPGASNKPSADLRFLFPTEQVVVHSTDDLSLPPAGEWMNWPEYEGRDLSRLGNWDQYLGFFEAPAAHGPFSGVYDVGADEGVLRVYPPTAARGSKGYAHGWNDALPSWLWTDDGSGYVEVHGGLMPSFWETATLLPGQVVGWEEMWYPVAGVGGVSTATEKAALRLERVGADLSLGLYAPAAHNDVDVYLWRDDCKAAGHWRLPLLDPAHPFSISVPASELTSENAGLDAVTADGVVLGRVEPGGGLRASGSLPDFQATRDRRALVGPFWTYLPLVAKHSITPWRDCR